MRAYDKEIPMSLKYMTNKTKILEHSDEENQSNCDAEEKQNEKIASNNKTNNKAKASRVYFYCPYNQSYTKFQNYDIERICELIRKYQHENYFIIQIDNDNLLYEEILKMQFKNESQIIHKMFDLKLDYSFSPFQDSLFFNMSILTDFFYDQIEKYLIQIFFHNQGIYIINKDSCAYIHQILMEKFIFYYVNNSEFFQKSVIDKNKKYKSNKMLINDFKIKNIIQKFQEAENNKTNKKQWSLSRTIPNSNNKNRKRLGSMREGSHHANNNIKRLKRTSTPDYFNSFSKHESHFRSNSFKKHKGFPKIKSIKNIKDGDLLEDKKDANFFGTNVSNTDFNTNKNYDKLDSIKNNINEVSDEILTNQCKSHIQINNNNYLNLFKEKNQENIDNSSNNVNNNNLVFHNNETTNFKNSFFYSQLPENRLDKNNHKNNRTDVQSIKPITNGFGINKFIDFPNNQQSHQINYHSRDLEILNKESFKSNIGIKELNKKILDDSRGSSISSKRSKIEREEVDKNNVYNKKDDLKSTFRQLIMNYEIRDSRDRDLDSEKSFSSTNIKAIKSNNEKYIDNTNRDCLDENMAFRKIFTFNEKKENEKDSYKNNEDEGKEYSPMNKEQIKNKILNTRKNNMRRFSDKRSHNLDFLKNFKEYEEYLEKTIKNMNKSHSNLEGYSQELMEIRNKLNDLSTNNNENEYFYLPKSKEKDFQRNDSNGANENDFIFINSKNDRQDRNSEENRLMPNTKENLIEVQNGKNLNIVEDDLETNEIQKKITFSKLPKKRSSKSTNNKRKNFSTDELIYYLFIFSLERLEEFTESLIKEADSLKGIYLELSEKERKDFFRRIHSMEVSMHIIHQETQTKKKFFKFAKNQFRNFNKVSNDFYFKSNFNFFLELMISKITQIELTFDTLENFLKMIKENYLIIIEDNTEKENVKLNYVMKVLTILTTIYAPMNIIPGLFGMNVKVPGVGTEVDSTNPFIYICISLIFLIFLQLCVFKKLRWL